MKRPKSLKQRVATVVSLTLVMMTIAACAMEQANAQQRKRRSASANNITVNTGSGNDTIKTQSRTTKPNRITGDWNGDGADTIGRRRNLSGRPDARGGNSRRRTLRRLR